MAALFTVVINHFAPSGGMHTLEASTFFCASLSAAAEEVASVIVVDGSSMANPALAAQLEAAGVRYHHSGRRLTFAEGYNTGLALSQTQWTVLCASDVYPSLTIYPRLAAYFRDADTSTLGCLIPRLSSADLAAQRSAHRVRKPVSVPLMTLNFNVFDTEYLKQLGGVPEEFGGYYNDVVLTHRMLEQGRRIILFPDTCVHYGSLTVKSGHTDLSFDRDAAAFQARYPALWSHNSLWHLNLAAFSRSRAVRALAYVARLVPAKVRWSFVDHGLRALITVRAL